MPTELRKVHADSTSPSFTCWVMIATIAVVVGACFIGAFAVPLPYLVVVADPVCPANKVSYTGFCAFQSFNQSYHWRSQFNGLNQSNIFIQVTGQFHVADDADNTDGALTRLFLQCAVRVNADGGQHRRVGVPRLR